MKESTIHLSVQHFDQMLWTDKLVSLSSINYSFQNNLFRTDNVSHKNRGSNSYSVHIYRGVLQS